MNIWRHLFRPKEEADKAAASETALAIAREKSRAAHATVTSELEKVLRGIAGDLTDAADKIGRGKNDGR